MLGLLEFVPEVRHQGLGIAVHEILVEKVRHLGANSLRIGVLEVNIAALKFWKSLGYIKFKETELYPLCTNVNNKLEKTNAILSLLNIL